MLAFQYPFRPEEDYSSSWKLVYYFNQMFCYREFQLTTKFHTCLRIIMWRHKNSSIEPELIWPIVANANMMGNFFCLNSYQQSRWKTVLRCQKWQWYHANYLHDTHKNQINSFFNRQPLLCQPMMLTLVMIPWHWHQVANNDGNIIPVVDKGYASKSGRWYWLTASSESAHAS